MIKFNKPSKLNGAQLKSELNDVGVKITESPHVVDDSLWLVIDKKDESKAKTVIDDHVGIDTPPVELSIDQKLANAGLNLQDLKSALGL